MVASTCLRVVVLRARWAPAAFMILLAMAGWAMGQQPIPGNYAPGAFTGMKGSIMAPPSTAERRNVPLRFTSITLP